VTREGTKTFVRMPLWQRDDDPRVCIQQYTHAQSSNVIKSTQWLHRRTWVLPKLLCCKWYYSILDVKERRLGKLHPSFRTPKSLQVVTTALTPRHR